MNREADRHGISAALVERTVGKIGLVPSVALVIAVAIGYPYVVRAIGVAPPVWQRP